MTRIFLVDDHPIVRQGLRQVLSDGGFTIVGEAGSGDEAIKALPTLKADVMILDLYMPGTHGLEVLREARKVRPHLPVLVLSIYPEEQFAMRSFRAGARGYLIKTSIPEELVEAVKKVAEGGKYVSDALAEHMAEHLATGKLGMEPHERISDREMEVFTMLSQGKTLGEIGESLGLSVKTVSVHRAHILKKTGLKGNAELMRYAVDHGMT